MPLQKSVVSNSRISIDYNGTKSKYFGKTLLVPFIIYADFEYTNKLKEMGNHMTHQDPRAFAYKVVCEGHKFTKQTITYVGKDASKTFLECMIQGHEQIMTILDNVKPLILSDDEEKRFQLADFNWQKNAVSVTKFIQMMQIKALQACNIPCHEIFSMFLMSITGYNSVLICQNLPICNPRTLLHNIDSHTKFEENR